MSDVSRAPERPCRDHLLALLAFTVIAAMMTWPLLARLGTHLPMGANDVFQNYWNFWWWKKALLELHQSPYSTDLIFHPIFRDSPALIGCHTHSPANILLTLPINVIFGVAPALNFAIFSGFVFAGFGLWLLARELGIGRGAAFLGGLVFAYFPQHVEQSLEHLNLASIHGMPLFLWSLLRVLRGGGWRWSIVCGALFALNSLFAWHNGLMAIPMGVALAVVGLVRSERPGVILLELGIAAVVAFILVAPFAWALIEAVSSGEASVRKVAVNKPIDLLFLVIPHGGHPIWGDALAGVYSRLRSYPSVGFVAYLGVSALALALFAPLARLRARRDRTEEGSNADDGTPVLAARSAVAGAWIWIALFLFFLILALGDSLRVARHDLDIDLPLKWLRSVPLFGIVRVPNRFLVPAALALAVLAAMGASALADRLPIRARRLTVLILGGVILLDLAWVPYPMRELPRPDWIHALDRYSDRRVTILDIPSGHTARASRDMFSQTLHGQPIASGYTASPLTRVGELLERYPVLRRIFQRYPPEAAFSGPTLAEAIRELGIDVVVLHLDRSVERLLAARERARAERPLDLYLSRLHNPETGTPEATLTKIRDELRAAFGEPVERVGDRVEIYETGG